jgi:tRNA A37 methylthiotransferase MiaB
MVQKSNKAKKNLIEKGNILKINDLDGFLVIASHHHEVGPADVVVLNTCKIDKEANWLLLFYT